MRTILTLLLPLLGLLACGDDDGPVAVDAATDLGGSEPDAAMDAAIRMDAGPYACGPEPRVHVTGHLTSYSDMTMGLEGVRGTIDLCPDMVLTSDEDGNFEGDIARGMPYNPKLERMGYIPLRTGQQILQDDFALGGFLFPTLLTSVLPHWGADRPTLLVVTFGGAGSTDGDAGVADAGPRDPCETAEGSVLSVVDHPEAVITYFAGTAFPEADPSLTATGPLGAAEISGLVATADGELVTLAVEKPGCPAITFASYPHTGRYVLEDGVLTVAAAFLDPIPEP